MYKNSDHMVNRSRIDQNNHSGMQVQDEVTAMTPLQYHAPQVMQTGMTLNYTRLGRGGLRTTKQMVYLSVGTAIQAEREGQEAKRRQRDQDLLTQMQLLEQGAKLHAAGLISNAAFEDLKKRVQVLLAQSMEQHQPRVPTPTSYMRGQYRVERTPAGLNT